MKQITDLPANDLWPIIFNNLSISDLFNCRLVNKQFKYFSDRTNGINKLIIGQPDSTSKEYYWHYNGKLIEDRDIISLKCFRSIKSILNSNKKPIFNLDKYLKYLKIYDQEFKLEELSNLTKLESIEFGCNYGRNSNQQITNLNNLKFFIPCDLSVKLNTPKLEKIMFKKINQIELDSSESIKHLITRNYVDELEIFQNLEIIELRYTNNQYINENLLILFKNLKQLKINLDFVDVNYLNDGIENSLIKILNDKIKLKKEIDIYLEGVKIKNMDKLDELKSNKNSIWNFRLNNYDLLDLDLSFIDYLNYYDIEKCFNNLKNDLPIDFFDKFQYINEVDVLGVEDVDGLNWVLNNLKYLTSLVIYNCAPLLGQLFYDNLPNSIVELIIYNNEDINYDFVSKLSKLNEFYTNVDKDLSNLIYTSFLNLKYFKRFVFSIEIQKIGKYFFLNGKKLNLNQLIEEYKKIRSK